MPPEVHSLLGASSSHRWLNCTRAPRLELQFPDSTSSYAEEGTLAHAICELKARKKFTEPMGARTYNAAMKKLKANPLYQEEMQKHSDTYLEFLTEKAMAFSSVPFIALEARLDYSHIAPEGFGTGDAIMIGDGVIQIVDFKYGQSPNGRVSAELNPQMMLYALGALHTFEIIYGNTIREARLAIVQPRLPDGISEWSISVDELLAWGREYAAPRAQLAYAGEGEFNPGEWCHFCKAKAKCRARAEQMLSLSAVSDTPPELLSDTEIGEVLSKAEGLVQWAGAVKDYALAACLDGKEIPGWKVVEGTSRRQWDDVDAAISDIVAGGVDEALLYERVPLTAPKAEKVLGSALFQSLAAPHVVKPAGKPTLVVETDKRPTYNAAKIAFGGANT